MVLTSYDSRSDACSKIAVELQKLMIEVYKSFNHLNPEYMWEFFAKKMFNIIFAQRNYASSLQ